MGDGTLPEYEPRAIEERWQLRWRDRDAFRTPRLDAEQSGIYIKASAPFTSGNVHIGHVRSYAIGDAYARFQRARGEPVLFAFGFDAFGLPAELGAIANGESPSEWVTRCAEHMTGQLRRLGFSFDWERTFMSSDAVMYRWSQWLFLTLLEAGLIYQGSGSVDWCDTCQTTLATIQVENGTCWRCHNPVRLIQRPQWYLRVSAYVEENDRRIAELEKWDETSLASQRYVLGRVDGVELDARATDGGDPGRPHGGADAAGGSAKLDVPAVNGGGPAGDGELLVFTPHAEGLEQARFVLMSPKHPEVERWAAGAGVQEQLEEMRLGGWERGSRAAETIALVDTGRALTLPGNERALPLLISPVVDERFGATAVLGVPALDRTDTLIARRIPGIEVDSESNGESRTKDGGGEGEDDAADGGRGIDGEPAGGVARGGATATVAAAARAPGRVGETASTLDEDAGPTPARAEPTPARAERTPARRVTGAREAVRYRANDFSISRQRAWGTPIPIVYCERCGTTPIPHERLPVLLPLDLKPTGEGNPLAEREDFVAVDCPTCGGPARRETDTLDCHFDALWLWIPACVPARERERPLEEILDLADLRAWLPSERLVAGSDSGNFMFDQRITTKALRDIGPLAFLERGEPFAGALMHEMVIREGRKMSKHLGNVVDPDELVETFGADTVRLAVLWAARPQKSLNWSDSAVQYCNRFLQSLWRYTHASVEMVVEDSAELDPYSTEFLRKRLEKWCEIAVEKITEDLANLEMHKAVRNVIRLLDRIRDFEKRVLARSGALCREDHAALVDALALMATVLAPFAPHVAQELLSSMGRESTEVDPPWPGRNGS